MNSYLFTSESVTEGHPDKLCDLISDAVLDAYLAKDPMARVACETFAYYDGIHIAGEITSTADVDIEKVARDVIARVGYTENECGFNSETCGIRISVCEQSPDIAMGVNSSDDTSATGAGDQGMMFGYACDETPELMPMPIALAHRLAKRLTEVRKEGVLPYLLPDGKTQVTIRYENDMPIEVETVVVSSQHTEEVETETLRKGIYEEVILPVIGQWMTDDTRVLINPTGRFVVGGPKGDVGLTGRKIIVDTYGGSAAHGGGAFSGKDPTKVDRTAAYMARCAAKNVVAAGLAKKCQIQLAYAIGVSKPVSVRVDTFGTGAVSEEEILRAVTETFDFTPDGMIEFLGMRNPIFTQTAAYGHFGREDDSLPWEKTEQAEILKKRIKG